MFCFEELVVLNPLNDVWHCLVGEVSRLRWSSCTRCWPHTCWERVQCLLTLGGSHEKLAEQSRQARKHFSQAVKLSRGRNARALIGLALATSAVDSTVRGRGRTDAGAGAGAGAGAATTNDTLRDVALSGLEKLYKSCVGGEVSAAHAPSLTCSFASQGFIYRDKVAKAGYVASPGHPACVA